MKRHKHAGAAGPAIDRATAVATCPRATYRLQFHADFTFADAEALVPYLDELGISHVYASPITTARRGSRHGYDVTDPTRVNPELGGEAALRRLSAALRKRGMGLIIDIVPNHMSIAGGENPWWQDVLENGQASAFARYFDIDWNAPLVLPVLGSPLSHAIAQGHVRLVDAGGRLCLRLYDETPCPLRPDDPVLAVPRGDALAGHDPGEESGRKALAALAQRQHYRLAYWRAANDQLNWRRFFSINELAGLRAEDPDVFAATHALVFRLFAAGVIEGVRVDHVDGLSDPAGYCHRLVSGLEEADPGRLPYVVVEKILAPGEHHPRDWRVQGTSGYDFMRDVTALLHEPAGREPLAEVWSRISGRSARFEDEEFTARRQLLSWQFEGQLRACVDAFATLAHGAGDLAWIPKAMLRRAVERLIWVFPVYRTYGTGASSPPEDAPVREAARRAAARHSPPGEDPVAALVLDWLEGNGPGDARLAAEAVRRFQQLSSPIAAKAVEDTAFYRHGVLLSANEVGSAPSRFSMPIADFHAAMTRRCAKEPHAMLALATHDHKRGADARARLAVLSGVPEFWRSHVRQWMELARPDAAGIDPADTYMLLQTLVGAWDASAVANRPEFLARVQAWQEKALREAKLRSSWVAPDLDYEARCKKLAAALLGSERHCEFRDSFASFMQAISPAATANSIAQTALQLSVPGVPDIYQGTELPDFSLVDPDNRRPVDFRHRKDMMAFTEDGAAGAAKLQLISHLLAMRRARPSLFAAGDYRPLEVSGPRAGHVVAFARREGGSELVGAVAIRLERVLVGGSAPCPSPQWWDGTCVEIGPGDALQAARLFATATASFTLW